jgi:hypothetical protein
MIATLHFAESAFPLHLLLQRLQRLIDVVIADKNLNQDESSSNRAPASLGGTVSQFQNAIRPVGVGNAGRTQIRKGRR